MTDNRPLADLIRDLAAAPSADPDRVPVARESLRAWAARIEALEAALDETDDMISSYAAYLEDEPSWSADARIAGRLREKAAAIRAALAR